MAIGFCFLIHYFVFWSTTFPHYSNPNDVSKSSNRFQPILLVKPMKPIHADTKHDSTIIIPQHIRTPSVILQKISRQLLVPSALGGKLTRTLKVGLSVVGLLLLPLPKFAHKCGSYVLSISIKIRIMSLLELENLKHLTILQQKKLKLPLKKLFLFIVLFHQSYIWNWLFLLICHQFAISMIIDKKLFSRRHEKLIWSSRLCKFSMYTTGR